MSTFKRKTKLVKPRLQLKLVLTFVGITAFTLSVQLIFLASRLTKVSPVLPEDGALLMTLMPSILADTALLSYGILLPLTMAVGILVVFRVAGPIYRFEKFLDGVKHGTQTADCRIRDGDELQDFCTLLNEVTSPLRGDTQEETLEPDEAETTRAA